REAAHQAMIHALLSARDQYSKDDDIFAAAIAHRLFKSLHEIRVDEAEGVDDE
ncbi:TPA: hypothetical protein QDC03_006501, partial [Burkholderia cepacia]|nr:hypothetical protein [Burkholderia cepacia]HDR9511292.1 hypothetical protein [Burkholderia cepacia]